MMEMGNGEEWVVRANFSRLAHDDQSRRERAGTRNHYEKMILASSICPQFWG